MTSILSTRVLTGEPRFFAAIAAAQAAVVVGGFGLNYGLGKVSYPTLPWTLYLHGALFVCWSVLAVLQPVLIGQGQRAVHRQIGWLGAALAAALVVSGMLVTVAGVRAGRLEPANIWMALNLMTAAAFLALLVPAIAMRRATDWHRRLLTCATILLTGPAWARILPMELLGPLGLVAITVLVLAFAGWGMAYDRRTRGRIHPAWWWGSAALAVPGVLTIPLALVPLFANWAQTLTDV